jgi:hypothetical protein
VLDTRNPRRRGLDVRRARDSIRRRRPGLALDAPGRIGRRLPRGQEEDPAAARGVTEAAARISSLPESPALLIAKALALALLALSGGAAISYVVRYLRPPPFYY